MGKAPLLFYLGAADDPQRAAVAPALAAVAERAGWAFDLYYDDLRAGRHFGGGDPEAAPPGRAAGSLVAGGRHAEHLLWLATRFEIVALGDPRCLLWPVLEALGAETLAATADPAELFERAFERLGQPLPRTGLVLDGRPQGPLGLVVAPYLFPSFLSGEPALGIDVSSDGELLGRLAGLGIGSLRGLYLERERAAGLPASLDSSEGDAEGSTYASLTAELARRHADWGQGVLLGDPKLVAAQLPKARRLRLLPLYGQPQTDVIERCEELVRRAREPVWGRQYDDHDFFALARLGHGLQVLDPDPPFDAARELAAFPGRPPTALWDAEPDDAQLRAWADEGRILLTLLFWTGMVRELHCLPPLLDLAAATRLRAGLLLSAETVEHAGGSALSLLSVPVERGGVFGLLEPLLASTGRGVAAEALMPPGTLAAALGEARTAAAKGLPAGMEPRGWWPLLDTELVPRRSPRLGRRSGRPVVFFTPRGSGPEPAAAPGRPRRDLRSLAGSAVRAARLDAFLEERRPFEHVRPGAPDRAVAEAVRSAGFSYMWTKAGFGTPAVRLREGDFVSLSLTAGNWDGWSPFYTVGAAADLVRAEGRLTRSRRPGWLAATVDSPLWTLPGELLERGGELYEVARVAAQGGRSGRLINVTPHVVARYARILDDRAALSGTASSRRR